MSIWQPVGTTSENYHPQSVNPDETVKESNLSTVTPSYHLQSIIILNDLQSDAGHDSVIPDAPFYGKVMVIKHTYAILTTSTSQQTKVMLLEALMRASSPDGNSMGVHIEGFPDAMGLGLR